MRNVLWAAVIASAAACSAQQAAAGQLYLDTNMLGKGYDLNTSDPAFWKNYGYRAQSIVRAGELGVDTGVEALRRQLEIDAATPATQRLFNLGAMLASVSLNNAISIYWGHEYIHFYRHDLQGDHVHYFYDWDDGEYISGPEAFLRLIFTGGVGGSATTVLEAPRTPAQTFNGVAAGVNWQMNYSEEWTKRYLFGGEVPATTATSYLLNRAKGTMYAFSDAHMNLTGAVDGDMIKIGNYYTDAKGYGGADVEQLFLYSAAGLALSPMTWKSWKGLQDYGSSRVMSDPFFGTAAGLKYTWDVPTYFMEDGMSARPTFYVNQGNYSFGLGYETPILGELDGEIGLTANVSLGRASIGGELSLNDTGGSHLEMAATFSANDAVDLHLSYVTSDGYTHEGFRNNPEADDLIAAGMTIRF